MVFHFDILTSFMFDFCHSQAAEEFLGITKMITEEDFIYSNEKGYFCINENGEPNCMGKNKGRDDEHPDVPDAQMQKLRDFYKPYNLQFYDLIGRDMKWS